MKIYATMCQKKQHRYIENHRVIEKSPNYVSMKIYATMCQKKTYSPCLRCKIKKQQEIQITISF